MNLLKINSINLWDETWELGTIGSSGQEIASNQSIRSKWISVNPLTEYYVKSNTTSPDMVVTLNYYAEDKTFISRTFTANGNQAFTTPSNCYWLRLRMDATTNYTNDIQVCLNSCAEKTTYHPHWVLAQDGQGKAVTADIASLLSDNLVLIDLGSIAYTIDEQSADYKLYKSTRTYTNIVRPTNNNNIPAIVSEFYGVVQLYAMPTSSTINKVSLSTSGLIFVETPPNETPKGYIIGTKA